MRHFSDALFNRFEAPWTSSALAGPQNRVFYKADLGQWEDFREMQGFSRSEVRSKMPESMVTYGHA